MYQLEIFHFIIKLAGKWLFECELDLTRRRDSKKFLRSGRALLAKGCIDEADVRFGLALRLWPGVIQSFSRQELNRLLNELDSSRDMPNANHLRLLADMQLKKIGP
jgi:hypothetical protein